MGFLSARSDDHSLDLHLYVGMVSIFSLEVLWRFLILETIFLGVKEVISYFIY